MYERSHSMQNLREVKKFLRIYVSTYLRSGGIFGRWFLSGWKLGDGGVVKGCPVKGKKRAIGAFLGCCGYLGTCLGVWTRLGVFKHVFEILRDLRI